MKMFSIVGWSGSGKTLLITRLIENFKARQRGVIAVKSTHAGYALQPEGKDTARFLAGRSREAYLVADGELLRMTRLAAPADLLAELQAGCGPTTSCCWKAFPSRASRSSRCKTRARRKA